MRLKRSAATQVIGIFAWGVFVSFMLRSVNAGIAGDLSSQLHLTSAQLGSLSSAYFLGFALMQLPLGVMLDRYGARRIQAVLLLIAAIACWIFSVADAYWHLWFSRALMGVGTAGALMSALKAFRYWYAAQRQQSLAALMMVSGTSGALFATLPVRWIVNEFGWRPVFGATGFVLLSVSLLVFMFVPRDEEEASRVAIGQKSRRDYLKENLDTYRHIFTDGYLWRFGLVAMFAHGGVGAMQALWLGPWLVTVQGLSLNGAAERLLYFNFAMLVGYFAQIALLRYTRLRLVSLPKIIAVVAALAIGIQVGLVWWQAPYAWTLWLLLAVLTTFFTMIMPHMSLSFAPTMAGRAYVAYNVLIFAGNWMVQYGFGAVVYMAETQFEMPGAAAFGVAQLVWAAVQLFGVVWLLMSRAQPARKHGDG